MGVSIAVHVLRDVALLRASLPPRGPRSWGERRLAAAPWLVTLSRHKAWVFAGAGTLIALSIVYVYALAPKLRGPQTGCPVDDVACGTADRAARLMLWISALVYMVGFFTAYVVGPMLMRLG